jgi:hypothetical protein
MPNGPPVRIGLQLIHIKHASVMEYYAALEWLFVSARQIRAQHTDLQSAGAPVATDIQAGWGRRSTVNEPER